MTKEALLMVDIQNDYFSGGRMELVDMAAATANAQQLLAFFRRSRKPVFHVQHISTRPGAGFFLPDTVGVDIHTMVSPNQEEIVVRKHFPNSFRETSLHEQLRQAGVGQLTICGAMSHMCIDSTVRAAFDLGYSCRLASDACATRDLEFDGETIEAGKVHATIMAALSFIFAQVVTTDSILRESTKR